MMTILYGIAMIIAVVVVIYMAGKNYDNMDIHYWTFVVLVPLILLGYWLQSMTQSPDAAMLAFCLIYLDSTILLAVILFGIMSAMGIRVRPLVKILVYGIAFLHLMVVCANINTDYYYSSIGIVVTDLGTAVEVTRGPLFVIHWLYMAFIVISIVALLIAARVRRGTYSRRTQMLYTVMVSSGVALYLIETLTDFDFSLLPFLYAVADILVAVNYDHAHTHDIASLVADQRELHLAIGYVAVDRDGRFLSCNEMAVAFLPELSGQIVDEYLDAEKDYSSLFNGMIGEWREGNPIPRKFHSGEKIYRCGMIEFSMLKNGKPQGYLFDIRDITEEEKTLKIMRNYNQSLNNEVRMKTDSIKGIQQKVVLGLANMVENRDSNTGGHVKRTSDIIGYIVSEVRKTGVYDIDEKYAEDIVRAAPMHDLGKITVENAILNKPTRLTDEEYAIMKTHSTKSGEFVHLILDDVEEQHFVDVAFNVARYHHERWDGRGYPEGLVGEMIPLEARIMAVADVYDALVSKRVYKPPMDFEKASEIMIEGMGTQFDPNMKAVFIGCRKELESYYADMR